MSNDLSSQKLKGYDFWRQKLNAAKLVVAPMVDQSELPWRLLSRRYGAELCYSPMFHASVFIRDSNYRREALASCKEDRPFIVQFCANNPETLLQAAKLAQGSCDAVDLNLGCPQSIAKRGHYGAFLQDEWDLIHKMVKLCAEELSVPITCKIRVFEDVEKTVRYAQMVEDAGCQLLTVHGRTREKKGPLTGLASWKHIKAVKESVKIPVFANGNIQYLEDAERCMKETGVDGVMSAEGNLRNPALFTGQSLPSWEMAEQYLELVEQYPCPLSYIRGHMFKLLHHALLVHTDIRETLGWCKTVKELETAVRCLKEKCQKDAAASDGDTTEFLTDQQLPYWICQPYVRPDPKDDDQDSQKARKRQYDVETGEVTKPDEHSLSKNKLKKLIRNPKKTFQPRGEKFEKCAQCSNPKGFKCMYDMCRACCKSATYKEVKDCPGHRFWRKSIQERMNAAALTGRNSGDGVTKVTRECPAEEENPAAGEQTSDKEASNGNSGSDCDASPVPRDLSRAEDTRGKLTVVE